MCKIKNFSTFTQLLKNNSFKTVNRFQDFKRVKVVSGNGGDGAIAFEKSAKVAFGPPNGGNGGAGGDVLVRASKSITCLTHLSTLFRADHGSIGRNSSLHGKKGEDTEIVVPVGTVVKEVVTSNEENTELEQLSNYELVVKHFKFRSKYIPKDDRINWLASRIPLGISKPDPILVDLVEDGQTATLVKGGRAGKGNVCDKLPHFVSHDVRGPPFCLRGERGREIIVEFELKSIADAGLVGLPNAGKSSFLAAVSRAHPKIAPYPFTTLNPYIGTIDYPDYFSMTLADIPGIIKGASRNLGLGHTFLRHIERSKILVYVIDLSNEAPWEDLFTLQNELELYSAGLTSRPSIIIANKADLGALCRKNLERLIKVTDFTVIPCSARDGVNITLATKLMRSMATKV
ncbi:Mitochondrial ribosome-associated GTPase 2 [Lobulomyces angularis]|nr:Mitochondrial ribosome-associated GTPase 2 [Lobulomyces angularis]